MKVTELLPGRAYSAYRLNLERMVEECGFSGENVPQLEDVSQFLQSEYTISEGCVSPASILANSDWQRASVRISRNPFTINMHRNDRIQPPTGGGPHLGAGCPEQSGVPRLPLHAVHEALLQPAPLAGTVSINNVPNVFMVPQAC